MRRNYTREAALALCDKARATIEGCSLSTDVIVGFCNESEEDYHETVDLMRKVKFENVSDALKAGIHVRLLDAGENTRSPELSGQRPRSHEKQATGRSD